MITLYTIVIDITISIIPKFPYTIYQVARKWLLFPFLFLSHSFIEAVDNRLRATDASPGLSRLEYKLIAGLTSYEKTSYVRYHNVSFEGS